MNGTAALSLSNVSVRYDQLTVVSDVSFDVAAGEFVTLLGPSGSGKTSLLRVIAGFMRPSAGEVRLLGQPINEVPPYLRGIGMVFQNYALFPHMTVAENLRFGLRMQRVSKAERERRVEEALAYVRLQEYGGRYPHELSGGQQQRVAIARALAIHPPVLLLDEPMSNLDARLRAEMRYELIDILERTGITALSVTHNQEEALSMSDRIVVMADGRIRQVGTPREIYDSPTDPFVADFIGDANVLPCQVVGQHDDGFTICRMGFGLTVHCATTGARPGAAVLLIRPEEIELSQASDEAGVLRGTVTKVAYMGAFQEYRVRIGDAELLIKKPLGRTGRAYAAGEAVALSWQPNAAVLLAGR
jgi:spermidine/putrescine ABC transporter ATP-binding subunit